MENERKMERKKMSVESNMPVHTAAKQIDETFTTIFPIRNKIGVVGFAFVGFLLMRMDGYVFHDLTSFNTLPDDLVPYLLDCFAR